MAASRVRAFFDGLVIRRTHIRRFLAEMMGTFLFVAFAKGCLAQVIFSNSFAFTENEQGDKEPMYAVDNLMFVSCVGEGFALMLGMFAAGRVSGGHLNPIISMTAAVRGRLTVIGMICEWLAQYIGAYLAANCVYLLYRDASVEFIRQYPLDEEMAASIFASQPQNYALLTAAEGSPDQSHDFRMGVTSMNVVLNSAIFVLVYSGLTDRNNTTTERNHVPVLCGLVLTVLGVSLGFNCGTAINPALDFTSRVFSSSVGWSFNLHEGTTLWWFWMPVILPHLGALLGFLIYQLFIGNHLPKTETYTLQRYRRSSDIDDFDGTLLVQHSEIQRPETERTSHVKIIG